MSYLVELEENATAAAYDVGISQTTWNSFMEMLDLHLPLMGGCGHDIGKCRVSNDLLNSTAPLTEEDFAAIHEHPLYGYEILKDQFPLTALVAGLHHKFGPKHYGIDLDTCCPSWVSEGLLDSVIATTNVVMICDFFDAMTTRRNSGSLVQDPRDMNAVAQVLQQYFQDSPQRCDWLTKNLIGTPDGQTSTVVQSND